MNAYDYQYIFNIESIITRTYIAFGKLSKPPKSSSNTIWVPQIKRILYYKEK